MPLLPTDDVKAELSRYGKMKSHRESTMDPLWQHLADYMMPRKSEIQTQKSPGTEDYVNELYDVTASQANMVLAAGMLTNTSPADSVWFSFEPPGSRRNRFRGKRERRLSGPGARWYEEATEIALDLVARSNFYQELHEGLLDRGGFGTTAILLLEGKRAPFYFKTLSVGTFVFAEDEEGRTEYIGREFKLSIRNAKSQFGEENLAAPMQQVCQKGDASAMDEMKTFVHVIRPRTEKERIPGRMDGPGMPIASLYIDQENSHAVSVGGFEIMPGVVGRFLAWGDNVWGWAPGIEVLPTVRQVNFIEKQMDALAETAAFPRVLVPESMEDEVDFAALGITYFDPNQPAAVPKEWMTQGRYDIGKDRSDQKRDFIRDAFHNDLFRMFAQIDQRITAFEAMQRVAEKLELFSPTFQRWTGEVLSPLLLRTFGILWRQGYFSPPPPEVSVMTNLGPVPAMPEVVYTSKIALSIRALENRSFVDFINIIGPVVGFDPSVMDNFELDRMARGIARNLNLPTSWTRDMREVEALRQQRAQAEETQAAIANAQGAAKAAKDIGQTPEPVRKQLANAFGGPF